MNVTLIFAVLVALGAAPAPEVEPGTTQQRFHFQCLDEPTCSIVLVPRPTLDFFRDNNNAIAAENLELRKALKAAHDELCTLKRCAKTEITEPSKNAPPKAPKIPREADS